MGVWRWASDPDDWPCRAAGSRINFASTALDRGNYFSRAPLKKGQGILVRDDQLWAPWRLGYITGATADSGAAESPLKLLPGADPACFICRGIGESRDQQNLIVERTELSVVIINRFPYNNGHLLVAPLRHQGRIDELTDHELLDAQRLIAKYVGQIERLMNAEGFNVGLNLGRAAGAGVPGHLHWHIVPRWTGDTNFMPALAGIRVIPQSLDALWELLHPTAPPGETAAPSE
jgi:ATP adenylyltransferase